MKDSTIQVAGVTVLGNWKMHGSGELLSSFSNVSLAAYIKTQNYYGLALPAPFVSQGIAQLAPHGWKIGGQDASEHEKGAYTGAVSASMLEEIGCDFCLVGHSERRAYQRESDAQVAGKVARLREHSIAPVVCVGETLEERENEQVVSKITKQLDAVVTELQLTLAAGLSAWIAYEPIWAIGTGKTATAAQAQQVHKVIRNFADEKGIEKIKLLYGGSVNGDTIAALVAQPHIDGVLVGGASLAPESWQAMLKEIC